MGAANTVEPRARIAVVRAGGRLSPVSRLKVLVTLLGATVRDNEPRRGRRVTSQVPFPTRSDMRKFSSVGRSVWTAAADDREGK